MAPGFSYAGLLVPVPRAAIQIRLFVRRGSRLFFAPTLATLINARRPNVPTLNAALAALERHCGFPRSRSRGVARRLQEANMLALGAPGIAPDIDRKEFVNLFVALAADTTLHEVARATKDRLVCTPGGVAWQGAPSSISFATTHLQALVDTALDAPSDLRHLQIEVVCSWPEVALHWDNGLTQRYQPVGTLSGHWQSNGHCRSTTVTGAAFRDAVRATFLKDR